jgi:hypothetical protein
LDLSPIFLEGGRRAAGAFARLGSWKEAAGPAPAVFVVRDASALADPSCAHIAVEDLPALLAGFRIAAAGEGGHAALKRGGVGIGKPLQIAFGPTLGPKQQPTASDSVEHATKPLGPSA